MSISHFKELIVWQKSMDLVHEVYKITRQFSKSEVYALASQMQRSAVSIPANVSEGQSRNHKAEFIQFLGIAFASSAELETEILIAKKEYSNLNYQIAESLLVEVQKMLSGLIKKLLASSN